MAHLKNTRPPLNRIHFKTHVPKISLRRNDVLYGNADLLGVRQAAAKHTIINTSDSVIALSDRSDSLTGSLCLLHQTRLF